MKHIGYVQLARRYFFQLLVNVQKTSGQRIEAVGTENDGKDNPIQWIQILSPMALAIHKPYVYDGMPIPVYLFQRIG